ncbi:MAG: hypothetical protein QM676_06215 [Novosphingobium sp.]
MATTFTVKADYEDYQSACWLMFRKRFLSVRALRIPLILLVVYFLVYLVAYCMRCGTGAHVLKWAFMEAWPATLFTTFAWIGFCALCIALSSRKTFNELGTMEEETACTFDELGFSGSSESVSVKLPWNLIKTFSLNDRVLVMYRTANMIHLLPIGKLDPAIITEVVSFLRTAGVKQR